MGAVADSSRTVVVVTVPTATECNTADETSACVVLVDFVSSLTVDAVVFPAAVAGNADVAPADGAIVALVVGTNNVGASSEDSVVLDVLPFVVFTSLVSVNGDDASVIGAAVVGANVDSVVPDALNVAIAADKELVSASVVGFFVTLLAVLETSEVRTTVSGFTDVNVAISFWADEGSFVPSDVTGTKVEALGAVADSTRTVVFVTVFIATECNTVDETSACVVLVDSGSSLTVDAVVVPAAVTGNADVILADGAVVALVVGTNNVGASADDSVVVDVLAVVVFTSLVSVNGDDASVIGAAVVGANVDSVVPDALNVAIAADKELVSASVVSSCVTLLAVLETSEVRTTVSGFTDVNVAISFWADEGSFVPSDVTGTKVEALGAVADSSTTVVVVTVPTATECNTVDETSACVVLFDFGSSLTVDAVVVPAAVAGNADVAPADGAIVALVVGTNNVGASSEDSVVLDVLPFVVFTSLVSVNGDDASVIGAAVVGANVDSVVPDALNVAIAADKELVSASVVGFIVTLLAVLETSEVRTTVSGFTDVNVAVSFWADEGSFVPSDVTCTKVEALGAVADSTRTVVFVTVFIATECNTVDETSACVVLVDSGSSLTVDAVVVPAAVTGNADVILADGAVVALVVGTNNVGASADDSVVVDVLAVVVFTSLVSVNGDDASVIGAAVVGANVDSVVPDALNVAIAADKELVSASVVGSCVTLLAVLETSEVKTSVSGFTDVNVVVSFWADEGSVVT